MRSTMPPPSTCRSPSPCGTASMQADVRDDGRGFDPGAPADGYGLIGMRERVALLRGELEIASSDAGTHVAAALPLE